MMRQMGGVLGWIEYFIGYFFGNMDNKWMPLVRKQAFLVMNDRHGQGGCALGCSCD
jgi:hypothetical protein